MGLMHPEKFEESLKQMKPVIYMNGEKIDSVFANENTKTVVEANKASYAWALDPEYAEIMTCHSSLINDTVNRYTHISGSIEDLVKKADFYG